MIYIKPITKDDENAKLTEEWIGQDDFHKKAGITIDDVFKKGTEAVMVYDEHGPVIAVRFHKALRVAMQFKPESRIRVAKIGHEVTKWLEELAGAVNCNEVIIRPGGKAEKFSEKLGFKNFAGKVIDANQH